jgi:FG-GAP-like repeat/Bacterial Ig-like domain (group 3)/FG-GAP repeat
MRFRQTLIGGAELLALLRSLWCFIAVVSFGQGVGLLPALAAPAPTITTLSVTAGGSAVSTVTSGSVVTLTVTVMAGSTSVTVGQVNFCDATAKFCTDIHLLGTAQLTANGTATLKFRPGVGSHSYKAVLAEPSGLGPSASTASSLTVTASQGPGQLATTTYLEASGVPNIYSLTATVPGNGNTLPTGMVSFVDASNGNAVLGTAALTSEPGAGFAGSSLLPVASLNSGNTVLTADFNGDGIPDLVILGNDTISVLLGNGDGTFTAAPYPSSELPGAIAVGDFNGDGILDLAVAPVLDEGNSEVLLGKGDGTFTIAKGSFGIANGTSTSNSIAVGDFNGDGNLDLVETCASVDDQPCNLLLIQFGNGDGAFMQSSGIPGIPLDFSGYQSVAVGDFNGDGKPDLAVTNSGANGVNVFLNSESGFSAMAASPATGDSPTSVAAVDFNGDGKLDLAVTNSGSNNVTILLGNGDGTFTLAASPSTGLAPNSLVVGDFNGDGVPDLAVANAGSSNVTILLGNGDGTFTAAASPAPDTGSTSVASADFNGDGKEDLVVTNSRDSSATALFAETALANATVNNISPRRRRHTSRQSDLFRRCQLWWQYLRRYVPNCGVAGLHAEWYFSFRRGWRHRDFDSHDYPHERLLRNGDPGMRRRRLSGRRKRRAHLFVHPASDYLGECAHDHGSTCLYSRQVVHLSMSVWCWRGTAQIHSIEISDRQLCGSSERVSHCEL